MYSMSGHLPLLLVNALKRHFSQIIGEVITDRVHIMWIWWLWYFFQCICRQYYYLLPSRYKSFLLFLLRKRHHFVAPLFISRCEENFICPVLFGGWFVPFRYFVARGKEEGEKTQNCVFLTSPQNNEKKQICVFSTSPEITKNAKLRLFDFATK